MGNMDKKDLTCPWHEETEGKICSINIKLDLIFGAISDLRQYNAKIIGGLIAAQVALIILLKII